MELPTLFMLEILNQNKGYNKEQVFVYILYMNMCKQL